MGLQGVNMGLRRLASQAGPPEFSLANRQKRAAHERLSSRMRAARFETDRLFSLLRGEALLEAPIPGQAPLIFYLGHLEAFDWTLLCRDGLGHRSFEPRFDEMFAPRADAARPSTGDAAAWPTVPAVRAHNRKLRASIDEALNASAFANRIAHPAPSDLGSVEMAIEHRLLHAEVLAWLIHRLPARMKKGGPLPTPWSETRESRFIRVNAGHARMGLKPEEAGFRWDHEYESRNVDVPAFDMASAKVTNGEFMRFVQEGGYAERSFWSLEAWNRLQASGIRHPAFWLQEGGTWKWRAMFGEVPLGSSWPVYVSHAEAAAYARWSNSRLPTEAEFHLAAYGSATDEERAFPWGNEAPRAAHGVFGFERWDADPVQSHPAGDTPNGISELVGNGWEWTSTPFAPLRREAAAGRCHGFAPNLADGQRFVLKGASPRTAIALVRRSFRNGLLPHDRFAYTTFRCVR